MERIQGLTRESHTNAQKEREKKTSSESRGRVEGREKRDGETLRSLVGRGWWRGSSFSFTFLFPQFNCFDSSGDLSYLRSSGLQVKYGSMVYLFHLRVVIYLVFRLFFSLEDLYV